jgi:hypothetical protein
MVADITPRMYVYGVIMMMFFIVGGMAMLSIMQESDASFDADSRSGEFNRTFNKLANVETEVSSIESSFQTDPEWGVFGGLNALIKGTWNTFSLMFSSWSFMDGVFQGLESFFGVPGWISSIIMLLITVTIAFAIYSLIFQKDS